ncbi:MAG TPA: HPF/RaiA family ribosome-associated protein [Opitutaceae bacterium]|nr:HPF/RaiA family ribosome-associated protein [Opitutaceae bacterium]
MNPSLQGLDPRVHFQGIHLELTESLAAAIYEKFGALLRHEGHIVRIEVKLQKSQTLGTEHLFDATGRIELRGPDLAARAEGRDAYGVLEALAGRLYRLLEKRHGRRQERRHRLRPAEIGENLPKTDAGLA